MKKIYFISLLVVLTVGCYCLKKVPVPPVLQGINFQTALPVFWGKGGHFYQAQLGSPFITAQKISFHPQKNKITLMIKGLKIQILDLLSLTNNLHEKLQTYRPYDDLLSYPLESLALAGIDTLQGHLICEEIVLASSYTQIDCTFKGDENLQMHLSCIKGLQSSWEQITCPDIKLVIPWKLVERYQAYATGRGYSCPVDKQDTITVRLTTTDSLKNIFTSSTKAQVLPKL